MKVRIYYNPEDSHDSVCLSGDLIDFYQGKLAWNMTIKDGNNSEIKKKDGSSLFDYILNESGEILGSLKSILVKQHDGTEWIAFDNSLGYRIQIGDIK